MNEPRLRRRLLVWFGRHARDLPWRRTRDPYRIWVSEVMLQQTQVAAVLGRYASFLRRFPNVRSLARSREEEVLEEWAGLGYYRRARLMRLAAREIVGSHGGRFPDDPSVKLPGIGRYSKAAVLSIAYGVPLPVLDGNVARVLSRLFVLRGDPTRNEPKLWALAERLLDRSRPGDFNQAMMELGATVCLPRAPRCAECPVRASCGALRLGLQDRVPSPARRRAEVHARLRCLLCRRDGKVLVERRRAGLLKGHWGLPEPRPGLAPGRALGRVKHQITHHKVTLEVMSGTWRGGKLPASLRWVRGGKSGTARILVSSLWKKALVLGLPSPS